MSNNMLPNDLSVSDAAWQTDPLLTYSRPSTVIPAEEMVKIRTQAQVIAFRDAMHFAARYGFTKVYDEDVAFQHFKEVERDAIETLKARYVIEHGTGS